MIDIYNGRGLPDGTYIQVHCEMYRGVMKILHTSKNPTAAAVFMNLCTYINRHGWATPSVERQADDIGRSIETVRAALAFIRTVLYNGKPILHQYRQKVNGQWGKSYYHLFPANGGADQQPVENLILWEEEAGAAMPPGVEPVVAQPLMADAIDSVQEEDSKEENHAPAARSAPAAQKKAGPVFRTKRQGELFHQPEKAPPPQPVASEEPITEANKIIAALFGKERLSKEHSSLLDKPIEGKDSERHASLNQLQEQAPEAFQQWMDKAFPKWRAGGGKEIKHFLHSLRVQSSNTYQPQDFDSVQKDIWGE